MSYEPTDVARALKDWLKTDLATRFPTLAVALELPADWKVGSNPVLVISDDGGPLSHWPVATSPTIRGTTWTSGRNCAYAYAAMTRLLTARIPGIAAILPGSGFLEARDSSTGADLVSFTVRARARTRQPL